MRTHGLIWSDEIVGVSMEQFGPNKYNHWTIELVESLGLVRQLSATIGVVGSYNTIGSSNSHWVTGPFGTI